MSSVEAQAGGPDELLAAEPKRGLPMSGIRLGVTDHGPGHTLSDSDLFRYGLKTRRREAG
jgi:hypothetical protein